MVVSCLLQCARYTVHNLFIPNLTPPRESGGLVGGREGSGGGRETDLVLPKACPSYRHEVGASFGQTHRSRLSYPTARTRDERHTPLDINMLARARVCACVCGGGGDETGVQRSAPRGKWAPHKICPKVERGYESRAATDGKPPPPLIARNWHFVPALRAAIDRAANTRKAGYVQNDVFHLMRRGFHDVK
jgi:hypothetical protein